MKNELAFPDRVVAVETSMKQAILMRLGKEYGHIGYDRKQGLYIGGLHGQKPFYRRSIKGVEEAVNAMLTERERREGGKL